MNHKLSTINPTPRKYYIIAGEASGDLHGSNLVKALLEQEPGAIIRAWGGDKMQAAGATIVKHYKDLAFMGFVEVLKNLRTILKNIEFCKKDITAFQPDVVVFVDYPGFNLRIAKWAKTQGYKTAYYIAPQVWAWKENRVKMMKQCIDEMMVILPFEKDYFKNKWQWDVHYAGHPLLEEINRYKKGHTITPITEAAGKPIVALLPGSRRQEIAKKLPIMLAVAANFPGYYFAVAQAPGLEADFYAPFLKPYPNTGTTQNATYNLLMQSTAALVTSGTATLETALFGVPEVVCYKGNAISYAIARRVVGSRIKYISLVNLIMDKEIVKELIQDDLNVADLSKELASILQPEKQAALTAEYQVLNNKLVSGGGASAKAANIIIQLAAR